MQRPKLQETLSQSINEVVVAGRLTQRGSLGKSKKGNKMIKFVLDNSIYCIALNEYANMVNILDNKSILLIVGKLILLNKKNVVLCSDIELYTIQEPIDTKKVKKELKAVKREF